MAYSDRINELKALLSGYSESEQKLTENYKTALENAKAAHEGNKKLLDEQYKRDRNDIFADNARDERNALTLLAKRGLGFSGETAQTKLDHNLILANRLGELTAGKGEREQKLLQDLADKQDALGSEMEKSRQTLNKERNSLLFDIAEMEQESELQDKKLKAEAELKKQELEYKYGDKKNDSSDKDSTDTSTPDGDASDPDAPQEFSPSVAPKDLAKLIVSNSADGKYVRTERDAYLVNKYLLELKQNYDISKEYERELLFMLKAYGYKEVSDSEMRISVISNEAEAYFKDKYKQNLDKYIAQTGSEREAKIYANTESLRQTLEYVAKNTEDRDEFFACCDEMGVDRRNAESFAEGFKWVSDKAEGAKTETKKSFSGSRNIYNALK